MTINRISLFVGLVATILVGNPNTFAQITTSWTNSGGNANFHNLGNWTNGIPGPSDEAIFGISGRFNVNMDNAAPFIGIGPTVCTKKTNVIL